MAHDGPLSFSDAHDLVGCISGCEYIDDARRLLSTDPLYMNAVQTCNAAVLNLCWYYRVEEKTGIDSMMLCHCFISTKPSDQHIKENTTPSVFWNCVGMVCFTLSMQFQLTKYPKLSDMLEMFRMEYNDHSKSYYKQLQLHILTSVKWKLFFPTATDITYHVATHSTLCGVAPMDSVSFIVCVAYSEEDLLSYSSHCIAIASIAVAIRYKTDSDSFHDAFALLSMAEIGPCDKILECSEVLYRKLGKFSHRLTRK